MVLGAHHRWEPLPSCPCSSTPAIGYIPRWSLNAANKAFKAYQSSLDAYKQWDANDASAMLVQSSWFRVRPTWSTCCCRMPSRRGNTLRSTTSRLSTPSTTPCCSISRQLNRTTILWKHFFTSLWLSGARSIHWFHSQMFVENVLAAWSATATMTNGAFTNAFNEVNILLLLTFCSTIVGTLVTLIRSAARGRTTGEAVAPRWGLLNLLSSDWPRMRSLGWLTCFKA